jgi:hypothetical protein
MKKALLLFLLYILSFIPFAQERIDSSQTSETSHTEIDKLIKQNDSIILLNARYEDSMRMLFNESNNKNTDKSLSDTGKREDKRNRQLYFRIGLSVFFLGLLVFRLVKKRKK